eukprot:TRINITY_DN2450_c0_g1_i1.p1 TRINITY_DN2450_c0_g1~~TRINITY_DN2450_c0_g1_i1.p1  ORF type:complete len:589 (+),score=136.23 TRINITY_DN2450_c0_g1_i1:89-1768(+)
MELFSLPRTKLFERCIFHSKRIAVHNDPFPRWCVEPQPSPTPITYQSILWKACCMAEYISTHVACSLRGERVGFLVPPSDDFIASLYAIWILRAVAVPLCPLHPQAELEYVIDNSKCKLIVYSRLEEFEFLKDVGGTRGTGVFCVEDIFPLPASSVSSAEFPSSRDSEKSKMFTDPFLPSFRLYGEWDTFAEDGALILYTSGTTSRPKGVLHTHGSIQAMVDSLTEAWQWDASDVILNPLPLHHIHGLVNIVLCALFTGAQIHFMQKFNASKVWEHWMNTDEGMTVFMAVPTIYGLLIRSFEGMGVDEQKRCKEGAKRLRLMVSGSAALPEPVWKKWKEITGHELLERYGMTEIGMALGNPLEGPREPGYVGLPFPKVEVRIVDSSGEIIHDLNAPGQLQVRGPCVFREYFKNKKATVESILEGGWFATGDSVERHSVRDGISYFKILGRSSVDILKCGGYKISALEIERAILELQDLVREAIVLGLPDEVFENCIVALVVPRDGISHEDIRQAILDHCKEVLAPYKIPREIHIVPSIEKNAMGKVNKKELCAKMVKKA